MAREKKVVGVRRFSILIALAGLFVSSACIAVASEYLTVGGDNARTGWLRNETLITKANIGQLKLLWKVQLHRTPRQMHNLFSPLVATVPTSSGPTDVAVVAVVSDDLWGPLHVRPGCRRIRWRTSRSFSPSIRSC